MQGLGEDDLSSGGAASHLAKYILDTGDMDGVMEFLQHMVRAGKVGDVFDCESSPNKS